MANETSRPGTLIAQEKSNSPVDRAAVMPGDSISRSPSATLCRRDRTLPPWVPTFVGRGIVRDIRARAPHYISDWTDAWNYRVVPAIVLIFFANVLPGIAFSLDLIETTQQYGVSEVLLSSFMAAFIFSIFGAQPLCIAGVTGPITVLNKTIFDIIERQPDAPNYLQFVGWVYLWGAILHWITAALNWCNFLRYVTLFSCDTFGFYVSWVYLQYGVQVITRQFPSDGSSTPPSPSTDSSTASLNGAFVGIILALLMTVTSFLFRTLSQSAYFHRHVRRFFADYGMPISLVASSAMAYWGRFNAANPTTLPTGHAFMPAGDRPWLVRFWELDGKWVGIAFPFGFALWVLFFFDHNVSSLMAQGTEFPLRKPPGFHYDFFLLGVTTFIAGLLGIPAPNGLIPQAPIHTTSLLVMDHPKKLDIEEGSSNDPTPRPPSLDRDEKRVTHATMRTGDADEEATVSRTRSRIHAPRTDELLEPDPTQSRDGEGDARRHEVPIAVVEQRVSNLAQGSLCLVLLTGPFLHVLNLIPRGVLAGLFWYMGVDALQGNGITRKILHFFRDKALTPADEPLRRVRKSRILLFVAVQLVGFGATMAITQTIAAIGFPIIIFLLVPVRMWLIPRLPFTEDELAILDGPTASPFTMESVGGSM
ncbi:anion exchanging protein [Cubamyces sp. BRFM 1775]|nr:anion exchanging protein [Cubamyces sp. BRFM 1775]